MVIRITVINTFIVEVLFDLFINWCDFLIAFGCVYEQFNKLKKKS